MKAIVIISKFAAVALFTYLALVTTGCGGTDANPKLQHDISSVQHIVFIIKENRTFDNYFASFPGADGAITGKTSNGRVVPLIDMPDRCSGEGLCNGWDCTLRAMDNGKMDRFDLTGGGLYPYVRAERQDVSTYWILARHFVLVDRFFTSVHGPSLPNHLFTVAAQSGGIIDNEPAGKAAPSCDECPSAAVRVLDAKGQITKQSPAIDFQTLPDLLQKAGVSWRYYGDMGGILGLFSHIRNSAMWQNISPIAQFTIDARAGRLPAVSWLLPPAGAEEHPPDSMCVGENWTADTMNAIMNGPDWTTTVVFLTWDDSEDSTITSLPPRWIASA